MSGATTKVEFVTPRKLPSSYAQAIGEVLHEWSIFEWNIERMCWHMLALPPKEGRLIFSQFMTGKKIQIFAALAERLLPEIGYGLLARDIAKEADTLNNTERNKIVHGRWGHPPGKPRTLYHYYVGGSADNRILPAATRMSSLQVRKLAATIREQSMRTANVLGPMSIGPDPLKNRLKAPSPAVKKTRGHSHAGP